MAVPAGAMLAYGLWFRGLAASPVAVSAMSLLSPVTAVVLGWIFLGQKIQGMALMGLIVVLASVMSIQRALARQAAGKQKKPRNGARHCCAGWAAGARPATRRQLPLQPFAYLDSSAVIWTGCRYRLR